MKKNTIYFDGQPVRFPCPIITMQGKKLKKKCCKKYKKKGNHCKRCPNG